ncbi:MAG: beta-ketoacyl synthase [Candidatus Rokubacteria bacterium]|nr:beta-ketoacyl synthase [Candidatus Rokubacteria bacterium]
MTTGPYKESVCVVGVGASTAIGRTAPASAAAVRASIAGFSEHPQAVDKNGNEMIVARAPYLPAELSGEPRLLELAASSLGEAMAHLRAASGTLGKPLPAFLGLPDPRPGLPDDLPRELTSHLEEHFGQSILSVETIRGGHSVGLLALREAYNAIAAGRLDFCLAGGADSYLTSVESLEWLDGDDRLHSVENSWGFVPGEAAGFCLLASRRAAARHALPSLAGVLAVTTDRESHTSRSDGICTGEGLTRAFRGALDSLSPGDLVDHIVCDLNGETYRAEEFGFAIARTASRFRDAADYLAPTDCWGDVGAASGPLFLSLAVAARQRGYSTGPHWLLWTSSENGERAAALLRVSHNTSGGAP